MEEGHHEVLCGKSESRQRKKRLLQQIREQLEFYFSPANISKDHFMSELLSGSEYINLEIFLKFNKIRSMTETVEMLRKAVGKSEILELSEDKTKLKLRVPYKPKDDELDCTIYVEHLPNQADHDWVRKVFSQYGTIDYISLPRYRQTGRPKGFAFVEFQNPAMSQVALKAFGSHSYRISADTDPAELLSIKTYEGDQSISGKEMGGPEGLENEKVQSKELVLDCTVADSHSKKNEDEKEDVEDKDSCDEKENEGKRKSNKQNLDEFEESEAKRKKTSNSSDFDGDVNSSKRKFESDEAEADQENKKNHEEKMEEGNSSSSKKKKKKRKRSKKEKEHEAEIIHLKVMSKQEWKTLRNRYLNMQKQNMQKLKRNMRFYRDTRRNREYSEVNNGDKYYESGEYMGTNYWYGDADVGSSKRKEDGKFQGQTELQSDEKRASTSVGKPEFIPGVLVKISFEEPLQDPKKLRETIREGGENVVYVDASARESEVIVRFAHEESAKKYIEMGRWSRMEILSGSKEEQYWKHIISCWEVRRNKRGGVGLASTKHSSSSKQHQFSNHQLLRGKDKVIQKAFHQSNSVKPNHHIIFTD